MGKNLTIITRSCNDALYDKWRMLAKSWENNAAKIQDFNGYEESLNFLLYVIYGGVYLKNHYAVVCDEDCFIVNDEAIKKQIEYMEKTNTTVSGVRDGGEVHIRMNSPICANPFFMIMNVGEVARKMITQNIGEIVQKSFNDVLKEGATEKNKKDSFSFLKKRNGVEQKERECHWWHNNSEPFHGLMYWIFINFDICFLDTKEHKDGITTIVLNEMGEEICFHTWYSREYGISEKTTKRIDSVIKEVETIAARCLSGNNLPNFQNPPPPPKHRIMEEGEIPVKTKQESHHG